MQETDTPGRGRPRDEAVRTSIHDALVAGMKEETYSGLTIDAVAKRARVSRTTIYRWYKDKDEIALEVATREVDEHLNIPESEDPDEDIRRFFRQTFERANEIGPLVTALMARAQADPDFRKKLWERFSSKRRARLTRLLKKNPELTVDALGGSGISLEATLDMVFGSIWYRMMSQHAPLDDQFVEELYCAIKQSLSSVTETKRKRSPKKK